MQLITSYCSRPSIFQVKRNESGWKTWFDKDAPEENHIPDGYETSLDTFRKLLLVRCGQKSVAIANIWFQFDRRTLFLFRNDIRN